MHRHNGWRHIHFACVLVQEQQVQEAPAQEAERVADVAVDGPQQPVLVLYKDMSPPELLLPADEQQRCSQLCSYNILDTVSGPAGASIGHACVAWCCSTSTWVAASEQQATAQLLALQGSGLKPGSWPCQPSSLLASARFMYCQ